MGLMRAQRAGKKLVQKIYQQGRKFNSTHFLLRIVRGEEPTAQTKFSFAAPTRLFPKAVSRNTLKRRGRAVVSRHQKKFAEGYSILITTKSGALSLSFKDFEQELLSLLRRANLISL